MPHFCRGIQEAATATKLSRYYIRGPEESTQLPSLVCTQVGGSGSWAVQAPPEQLALVLADTQILAEWTLTAYWEGLQTLLSFLPAQVRFCTPIKGRQHHSLAVCCHAR